MIQRTIGKISVHELAELDLLELEDNWVEKRVRLQYWIRKMIEKMRCLKILHGLLM